MDKEQVIERLWENSGHGTRRQDIEAAYAAGIDARRGALGDKLTQLLARCKCGVFLTVNEHRDCYESPEQRLEWYADLECPPTISDDVRAGILSSGNIVDLHFYPDTPIGSYHVVHFELDAALDQALACLQG